MRQATKKQTVQKHIGYGKVILFGEHVVVHGAPAIVAGITEHTECSLKLTPGTPGWTVVDQRPAVPGYITSKADEQKLAHKLVFEHLKIDLSRDGVEITLGGPLVPSSGIGASASDVVSLSRALSEMYHLELTEEQVNEAAFVGEGGYHGTPSGVDNTAATYGGLLTYRREQGKSRFGGISFREPLYLVVVGTGITASTSTVVGDVKRMKEKDPAAFEIIMQKYNKLVQKAQAAIEAGDVITIGALMSENHALLQQLRVSCAELEAIVTRCKELGALGAKLSGTGRGGIAVALCATQEQQEAIAEGLSTTCPQAKFVWKYSVIPRVNKEMKTKKKAKL